MNSVKGLRNMFGIQNYGKCLILVLALTTNVTNALHTLETPIREALLKPRNFNPHPYDQHFGHHHHQHHIHHDRSEQQAIDINAIDTVGEDYIDNSVYNILPTQEPSLPAFHPANHIYSQAPVQFPPALPPNRNIQSLPHPYASLKYKGELNRVNTRIPNYVDDSLAGLPKKQYAFSYTVRDRHSGDDFSHTQQQNNGAVKGTYKVQLPDGRTQVVRYTADNDGYRADVSYVIDKNAVDQTSQHHNRNDYNSYAPLVNTPAVENAPVQTAYHYSSLYDSVYNQQQHPVNVGPTIPTPTSTIYVSTIQPPTGAETVPDTVYDNNNYENLELRKSISSRPTYVVSAKSTHITDNYEPNPNTIDSNVILTADHSAHSYQSI